MQKHRQDLPALPGTGAELAHHLIKIYELEDYRVETTPANTDHFDPASKCIRLSPDNYNGKSVTAIAIAAHEFGHALQHFRNEPIFRLRSRYIPRAKLLEKAGVFILMAIPILALVIKSPVILFIGLLLSLFCHIAGAMTYLIVLPEEWDASFNKALPLLIKGAYLPEEHIDGARHVLKAAALTYFAAALASLLNIGRWLVLLRR